jgi:DNA-binding response OmpR family regulator
MSAPVTEAHVNLKNATILLAEPNLLGMDILGQILMGFGAKKVLRAENHADAKHLIETNDIDLIICEGALDEGGPDGYDLIHWLRRSKLEPNAFAPVLLISAHTSTANVARARDCGANFLVAKPLSSTTVLERIVWVARQKRSFVSCDVYVGPDRRFKNHGPPEGSDGRRSSDLRGEVATLASEPNMSQDQIDNLIQPQRATL